MTKGVLKIKKIIHGSLYFNESYSENSGFYLWGENNSKVTNNYSNFAFDSGNNNHPFGMPRNELVSFVEYILGNKNTDNIGSGLEEIFVYLPNDSVLSQLGLNRNNGTKKQGLTRFGWWKVECIRLDLWTLGQLLIKISNMRQIEDSDVYIGTDLLYWNTVYKFALKLLAKQKVIPKVREIERKKSTLLTLPTWEVLLNNTADVDIFNTLQSNMPVVCRVLSHQLFSGRFQPVRSDTLLRIFLNSVVDDHIKTWLESNGGKSTRYMTENANGDLILQWLSGLGQYNGLMKLTFQEYTNLKEILDQWTAPIEKTIEKSNFRTCFCLEPPDDKYEISLTKFISKNEGTWSLQYFIQAVDDPSLLIAADHVWSSMGEKIEYLNKRFDFPQERLLIDLKKASEIFKPLRKTLLLACPTHCELSLKEVTSFVTEYSLLLQEMGYGILIPILEEGKIKNEKVSLRLQLKDTNSVNVKGAQNFFGLKSIVEFDWKVYIGDQVLSEKELEQLISLKIPIVRYKGRWIELNHKHLSHLHKMIKDKKNRGEVTLNDVLRLDFGFDKVIKDLPIDIDYKNNWLKQLLQKDGKKELLKTLATPNTFVGELRPYQVVGFSWLHFMAQLGLGACLADDMGLGKTIQYIAFLLFEKEARNINGPSLLICPTTILTNWCHEITRFAPSIKYLIYHDSPKNRQKMVKKIKDYDLILTTYAILQKDLKQLQKIKWAGIVLDEAQNIKNPRTKKSIAIKKLQAGYRIVLTGTPIENHLSELWSIFDFLNPKYFGGFKSFKKQFIIPIERYQHKEAIERLNNMVRPFVLRRIKSDKSIIKDLPEKVENKVYCGLSREQITLYSSVLTDMMLQISNSDGIKRKGLILSILNKLKQICNHPAQFLSDDNFQIQRSGKFEMLITLISKIISKNEHVLIFTQYVKMGEILKKYLENVFNETVLFLHGSINRKKREQLIKIFQEGQNTPHIFILSIRAGGLGLNLTRAHHVIHYDRWWNPAVENQATDRAYRIGQEKDVMVYKLISHGTIEEQIDKMIEKKKFLADSIINKGEAWITELSDQQLEELFNLKLNFSTE
ncbi:MAG: DEAD/DEAH box helicase [Candidatus Helarchaeota archaeon]